MWAFCEAVLAGAGKSNGLIVRLCWRELCRNKLHCMSAFCESVSVWVPEEAMDFLRGCAGGFSSGLSVRFLAGAGRNSGLSVRLCWREL